VKHQLKVGKHKVEVSNLDKVLYPAAKFTKGEVIDYYVRIAPWLLPHFRDRPVTLKRFPNGVHGEAFYEKDAPAFTPAWVKTFPVPRRDTSQPPIDYIIINDAATLAWAANAASLELHPFLHRVPQINIPTLVTFDLDPGEGADILTCAEVAFLLREALRKLGLKSFPKVSGSKGLQVYLPLNVPIAYEATQSFARTLADLLARDHPGLIVSDMAKLLRRSRVFIDWSQNADHKTTIGAYSLRAKGDRPFVSMPVTWRELKQAATQKNAGKLYWDAGAALKRVEKVGDLFAPLLNLKQKLPDEFMALGANAAKSKPPKSLAAYQARRNFTRTAEPGAAATIRRSAQGSRRRFVIQKHAASHLHYDFRLEIGDVLKSWAVPKGVPFKEGDAASAFATEDHPIEYLEFEGTIPKGQYGGGTVMVWDIGTYEILEGNYWKGRLAVHLAGSKCRGAWTLEKTGEENGKSKWLLIKSGGNGKSVSSQKNDKSALSGRTLEQIKDDNSAVWQSGRSVGNGKPRSSPAIATPPESAGPFNAPQFVRPMKATLTKNLPAGPDWLYEIKWDGYRAMAAKHGSSVRLLSLKNKNLNSDFPAVVEAVRGVTAHTALLDGEIVAVNHEGKPSFQILQNRNSLGRGWHIVYYAFDLLNLDGADLTRLPLEERKSRLKEIVADSAVRYSAELNGTPAAILAAVKKAGLEGVIAKQRCSLYRAGSRVTSWLKLKLDTAQEFVIGGYKPEDDSFRSLLTGYYEGGKLIFAGKVRQGFNKAIRTTLMKIIRPLVTPNCPFSNLPSSKKGHFGEGITADEMNELVWLKPALVVQCSFTEWTNYGLLRHATFLGIRDDKEPREVIRET